MNKLYEHLQVEWKLCNLLRTDQFIVGAYFSHNFYYFSEQNYLLSAEQNIIVLINFEITVKVETWSLGSQNAQF